MKKIPLQLRMAGVLGVIGGGVGSLVGAYFSPDFYNLAIGSFVGFTVGFIIGYRIGGMIKTTENIARAEQFASGADIIPTVLAWLLVAAGIFALIVYGWNFPAFLATLFFLMCSLYLTHRRFRAGR